MTGQEKLPDGLECCFKALAKAVFSEEGTVYFHRTFISFDGSDRTRVITRYANMAMEKGGDIAVAAKAVMIYPAIKWLLKAREIEAVIAALPEEAAQGDFCRLVGMQSMLVRLTGEKPEMRLQVRREFFERCQEFTDAIFKAVLEAEFVCKYFHKGDPILVCGSIQSRQYTSKEGEQRTAYEILANNVSFASERDAGTNAAPAPAAQKPQATANPGGYSAEDFAAVADDEDLPF